MKNGLTKSEKRPTPKKKSPTFRIPTSLSHAHPPRKTPSSVQLTGLFVETLREGQYSLAKTTGLERETIVCCVYVLSCQINSVTFDGVQSHQQRKSRVFLVLISQDDRTVWG